MSIPIPPFNPAPTTLNKYEAVVKWRKRYKRYEAWVEEEGDGPYFPGGWYLWNQSNRMFRTKYFANRYAKRMLAIARGMK